MLTLRQNESLIYPTNDRDIWGSHFWVVFHELAATHKPSSRANADKKVLFKLLAKYLPCGDCSEHATDYMKKNPLTNNVLKSPESLFRFTCEFHNSVRKKKGQPQVDCAEIYDPTGTKPQTCLSCYDNKAERAPVIASDIDSTLVEYRRIIEDYFRELCYKDELPVPKIVFEPCPSIPSTSCNDFRDKNDPKVYMNPLNVNLRVVGHEYEHYRAFMTNGKIDEKNANDFAIKQISDHFGLLKNDTKHKKVLQEIAADTYIDPQPRTIINGPSDTISMGAGRPTVMSMNTTVGQPGSTFSSLPSYYGTPNAHLESFPMYAQYMNGNQVQQIVEAEQVSKKLGVLSHVDGFYRWPAKHIGLTAEDLNLFNTSLIMKNVISTIIESNTTQLGSVLFSSMLGMILFVASSAMKKNLRYRDKQLLQLLAASFLWDLIRNLNPKNAHPLKQQVANLVKGVKSGSFTKTMAEQLFETPKTWKKKTQVSQTPIIMTQNGPVAMRNPANVYAASTGDGDLDKVKTMVASQAGAGIPMAASQNEAVIGASNAVPSPYGGAVMIDPSTGQQVQMTTAYDTEGKTYFVPRPLDEFEQMYNEYYTMYAEPDSKYATTNKMQHANENEKYLYSRDNVNPYSFRVNY
jgi:hypothetical protein